MGAQIETLTLGVIQPFVMVLTDPSIIYTNRLLNTVYSMLRFRDVSHFLAFLAVAIAIVYAARGLYVYFFNRMQNRFLATNTVQISNRLLASTLRQPYLYHTNNSVTELQRVVTKDAERLFSFVSAILSFLVDSFMAIFMLAFLMITSFSMTIVVLFFATICLVIYFRIFKGKISSTGEEEARGIVQINKAVLNALSGVKEIKIMRRESFFVEKFKAISLNTIKTREIIQSLRQLPKLFIESLCFSGAFIVLAAIMLSGVDLQELVPLLGIFLVAAFKLLPAISRLTNSITQIMRLKLSVSQVYQGLFGHPPEFTELPPEPENKFGTGEIIVHNLSFQYPKARKPTLRNTSLKIPINKSVAFIGPSGAGKTTLVDIILGILPPQSGYVLFNGESIHHNFDNWAKRVGYIPQVIYLQDETIMENVAFGAIPADIDEDKVWHALEQAQLKDFVISLPEGLQTKVGDRGVRLSGGQRQRIGIARALYNNPEILVLDEATAALDNDTEKAVMDAIKSLKGQKTLIIVAHRLSTIEHCDIIYKVENRRVTETTLA